MLGANIALNMFLLIIFKHSSQVWTSSVERGKNYRVLGHSFQENHQTIH